MVVASNYLVQNANNMSLTKKNNNNQNNNNNNNNNDSESEVKVHAGLNSCIIKLNSGGSAVDTAKDKDAESAEAEIKAASKLKSPCCMLMCRDNSHPFQDRVLNLDRPVKIGRTVARAKASMTNAIFDCKVLSRHHALLWFKSGKFYLQDTKSSNGTFINNQRLSATNEQSAPREVCSGDIVQFGVNVVENTKNVQHGCIIATLRLYLPDGTEAKASNVVSCPTNVSLEDLYKLNQYLQEAMIREKTLRFKLSMVQRLVESTRKAADQSWKSYIDEDKLLSRIEIVEGQLVAYSKNFNNDKIREELVRLQEEKAQYQMAAKESLKKILKEKLDLSLQLEVCSSRLDEAERNRQSLLQILKSKLNEAQEFAAKYTEAEKSKNEALNKLEENEEVTREIIERTEIERDYLMRELTQKISLERKLLAHLRAVRVDLAFVLKQLMSLQNYVKEDDSEEGAEGKCLSSKASELIIATLNKLNSMIELQDSLDLQDLEDEDKSIIENADESARLDAIRNSIEAALSSKVDMLRLERGSARIESSIATKIEDVKDEANKAQPNGVVIDKIIEEKRLDHNDDDNSVTNEDKNKITEDANCDESKLIEQMDAEKTEDASEKLDYTTDGTESDVTEVEILQREQLEVDCESLMEYSSYKEVDRETENGEKDELGEKSLRGVREAVRNVKNERQRAMEEELEALREKCRALEEQEALLSEKYSNLQNQCGDLLNATYMVPIQYVAPIAIVLLWMLLEKIF